MEKLYTSKTFLKMAGGRMDVPHPYPWIRPWPLATETIKRVWYILVNTLLRPHMSFFSLTFSAEL